MLLSMTGYGDARSQNERLTLGVEVRSVNNRYLKISTRSPDSYSGFESQIEKLIRKRVSRGTINLTIRADRLGTDVTRVICQEVLKKYWDQARQFAIENDVQTPVDINALYELPGVITEDGGKTSPEDDWPLIQEAVESAMEKLQAFRRAEGESMQDDLREQLDVLAVELEKIVLVAPEVVKSHRDRLIERVREMLSESEATVEDCDLIREVSIYADRVDINEEITRLKLHLEQFANFISENQSQGRKLEFLGQEMFREVNTIGSKANNVAIAHSVVEMKAAVEKIREILQNVE